MKIKKTSLPDEICSVIKKTIKAGEWKSDSKLPSENELAEMFGVNRLTVRMALQKLAAQGIVETKVGEGTFIKDFNFKDYISEVSDFYLTEAMIDNVCEFRKSLEVESARLAMERGTPAEMDVLGKICDRYDETVLRLLKDTEFDPDIMEEIIQRDLEFHSQIVQMSKNTLYHYSFEVARESIIRYLHIILIHRIDNSQNNRKLLAQACAQHRIIYNALKAKDFEICRKAMLDMIDYTAEMR